MSNRFRKPQIKPNIINRGLNRLDLNINLKVFFNSKRYSVCSSLCSFISLNEHEIIVAKMSVVGCVIGQTSDFIR